MKMETVYHCLTLKWYKQTNIMNLLQVNQQHQYERKGDRQVNETTISCVYIIHKQQWSSNRVLEKAKTRMFYFKNVSQTVYVGI